MSTVPSTQISFFVNAGAKAISLAPCDKDCAVDVRINVATGVSAWFATTILGKSSAEQQGAPKYIRWTMDPSTLPVHTTEDGREMYILDLRETAAFKSWCREVAPLAQVKGSPNTDTANMLAELTAEFGGTGPVEGDDDSPF